MVAARFSQSVLLLLILISFCCGCSSGSGSPVTPGTSPAQQYDPARFASDDYGSSDECLNNDPRFRGWTNTGFGDDYDFNWAVPPDWAQPGIGDIEFDRFLKGWIVDPHHKVNTLSLTLTVDEICDLSKDLTYMAEVLPDGGYVYHWQCYAPEKYLDHQRHLVTVIVSTLDNTPLMNFAYPKFKPLELPGIGAVYYPWRDVRLPVDEQIFDPERIKVFIEGDFYVEWRELISDAGVWNVKGYGSPLSVELEQVDTPWPIAVLNLKEPIEFDTELEFGPVYLEDGLIAHDVERIFIGGHDRSGQGDLEPCYCSMEIIGEEHHDYIQTENFAWGLNIDVDGEDPCDIRCSDEGSLIKTPTCSLNPKDPDNWGENADTCTLGIPEEMEWYMRYLRGNDYNTRPLYDGRHKWQLEVSWIFGYVEEDVLECPESGQRTVTISEDFTAVDTTNPMFLEEPRLVYGPEAADWLEEFWDPENNPNFHEGFHPPPSYFRNDPCGIYLLVHASDTIDENGQGVLGIGDLSVDLDIKKTDGTIVFIPYPGVNLGAGIWIDHYPYASGPPPSPPVPGEYAEWPDTDHYPYGFPNDNIRYGEERIVVIGMEWPLSDPEVAEVKVRVEDAHSNWVRSGNLLEELDGLHTVTKVGIITEDYSGTTVLSDFCNVPVAERDLSGTYELNYAAQVVTSEYNEPPEFIWSKVSSPTHEGNAGPGEINVALYRVDPDSDRFTELNALFPDLGAGCNVHYYSRGLDLDGSPVGSCIPVYITDLFQSQEPLDENDFITIPNLFVSDDDSLLPANERDDYSVASCGGVDMQTEIEWHFYSPAIDALYYGELKYCRGKFLLDCDDEEVKQNCVQDILKCGVERITAYSEGESADLGIQSRGDVYFVLTHGKSPDAGKPNYDPDTSVHWAMGDFIKCNSIQYSTVIDEIWVDGNLVGPPPAPYDWMGSELKGPEVKYLISDACSILNITSYSEWQDLIKNNNIVSISAFRSSNYYQKLPGSIFNGNPSQFFASLSARLTNCDGQPMDTQYWVTTGIIPYGDEGVIGWMENACFWAREQDRLGECKTVQWCSSINDTFRYILKQQLNTATFPPKLEWKIFIG